MRGSVLAIRCNSPARRTPSRNRARTKARPPSRRDRARRSPRCSDRPWRARRSSTRSSRSYPSHAAPSAQLHFVVRHVRVDAQRSARRADVHLPRPRRQRRPPARIRVEDHVVEQGPVLRELRGRVVRVTRAERAGNRRRERSALAVRSLNRDRLRRAAAHVDRDVDVRERALAALRLRGQIERERRLLRRGYVGVRVLARRALVARRARPP